MSDNFSENQPGQNWYSFSGPYSFRTTIRISIIVVFVVSFLDLSGWIFKIALFKSLMPQLEPMKLITALCFVFAAAGLMVIIEDFPGIIRKTLPIFFAIVICCVSMVSAYANFYSLSTGNESSISTISSFNFFLSPEKRMALLTSCNFLLSGCILFLLSSEREKTSGIAHLLIVPVLLISYFTIVRYILDSNSRTVLSNISVSLNTSIAFCAISAAVLLMRPNTWLLRIFTSGNTGGIIARNLLPGLVILPVIIGWLRINGERAGLFKSDEGVVLVAITYTVCFLALVWITARSVNNIDNKRKDTEEALKKSFKRMELLSEIASGLLINDNPQRFINELCIKVMKFLDCQIFFNFLVDDSLGKLHLNAYEGISAESAQKIEWMDFEVAICGLVVRDGKSIVAGNIPDTPDSRTDHIKSFGIKAYTCYPLLSRDKVIGTLSFGTNDRINFSDDDLSLLKVVADQVAIALTRVNDEEAMRESEIKLKELNATKDKFFNIVAHDLKNPFTSMLGSSELLSENIHRMNIDDIKNLSLILNDSAKNGYAILQNLLDWSRSQTGELIINPEKISLKNLIDKNISSMELAAANKDINIYSETEEDLYIFADKNMINTVMRNLLSNAIKFTHRCGKVVVCAGVASDEVIISVKDTGRGIPEENIKKLFRIDSRNSMPGTENEQGTGLGLKLSKEFIEKQGGRIWVESIENQGSEFSFSIPLNSQEI